jgi:hypothetical protein
MDFHRRETLQRTTMIYIGIGTFLGCWVLLFFVPFLFQGRPLAELTRLATGVIANYLLLTFIFAAVSVVAALTADWTFTRLRRLRPFQPKLGQILVRRGYITEEQLEEGLALQKMRLGELLINFGGLTEAQLDEALLRQETDENRKRLGEILKELGYASPREVQWASERVHQKLGRILVGLGLISKEELRRVLGRQWYGRKRSGR